ncbi:MAG: primosomal protein N', partial [Sedimentisphaerales bacterium]|nr:primosomal protein N' [Sedimentisphaerales bacterium]
LLLNRRGYSHFVVCTRCRYTLRCRNCDATMTFHQSSPRPQEQPASHDRHIPGGFAMCHYCLAKTLVPATCPLCQAKMSLVGLGCQRLQEELHHRFPGARIARLDSDSMKVDQLQAVLKDFAAGRVDILAGTQILAKGLDFPNVTVVGIVSADTALYLPDFRSNERTFQLICQVAGRAGRADRPGTVYVQTFMPDQPAIRAAIRYDLEGFFKRELKDRQAAGLPPITRMALITLQARSWDRLEAAARTYRQVLDQIAASSHADVQITGPTEAPIARIQRRHRLQIVLRAANSHLLQAFLTDLRKKDLHLGQVKVSIDVDPVNLM